MVANQPAFQLLRASNSVDSGVRHRGHQNAERTLGSPRPPKSRKRLVIAQVCADDRPVPLPQIVEVLEEYRLVRPMEGARAQVQDRVHARLSIRRRLPGRQTE